MVATAAEYGVDKTKDQNKEKPMVEENTKEEKKKDVGICSQEKAA